MDKKFFLIILAVVSLIAPTVCVVKSIQFKQNCSGYLKQAADANSPELSLERLNLAVDYIDEHQWELPEAERKEIRFYYEPGDIKTIRELLAMDDAKFRNTSLAKRFQRIRVPSLKRSDKEWENFYRTWPWLGAEVAVGNERFCDGAKLKYIPLFKKILDEEWPEDLKPWTEEEYDKLITEGKIN